MADTFSKLELVWRTRKGGGGKTQRNYLDFVVDGKSLSDLLKPCDLIGCLGWQGKGCLGWGDPDQYIFEQLTTKRLSDLGNDRYPINICPQCADIGCGAITSTSKREAGLI